MHKKSTYFLHTLFILIFRESSTVFIKNQCQPNLRIKITRLKVETWDYNNIMILVFCLTMRSDMNFFNKCWLVYLTRAKETNAWFIAIIVLVKIVLLIRLEVDDIQ